MKTKNEGEHSTNEPHQTNDSSSTNHNHHNNNSMRIQHHHLQQHHARLLRSARQKNHHHHHDGSIAARLIMMLPRRFLTLRFMIPMSFFLSLMGTFLHGRTVLQQFVDHVALEQEADQAHWMGHRHNVASAASKQSQQQQQAMRGQGGNARLLYTQENALNQTSFAIAGDDDDATTFFSACLIIMDDNHWLTEFLAYHYHALNLRRLVFVRDPLSITSPNEILRRYSNNRMFIEEWKDEDFLPPWILKKASQYTGKWVHLNRQKHFYGRCIRHLHPHTNFTVRSSKAKDDSFQTTNMELRRRYNNTHASWLMLTDTDEFIRVNPTRFTLPIHVRQQAGHVVDFLNKRQVHLTDISQSTSPCLIAPRIQVSSLEFNETIPEEEGGGTTVSPETVWNHVAPTAIPPYFNASDFMTFRWLQHNGHEMEAGKNILYLPQLEFDDLPLRVESVHYTLPGICPKNTGNHLHVAHLQIQHYLGTFEQFTYRNDPRDVLDDRWWKWHTRGKSPEPFHYDLTMTDWLQGFVDTVGLEEAQRLLAGVGQLEPRPPGYDSLNPSHYGKNSTRPDFKNMDALLKSSQIVPKSVYRRHKQLLLNSGANVSSIIAANGTASAAQASAALAQQQKQLQRDTFGACLITKDDNHWLIEWLAYHYHVLPLRHLFIVQDPTSTTSLDSIMERWKGRLSMEQWYDADFIPTHIQKKYARGNITQARLHRYRQEFFYAKCLQEYHVRRHNETEEASSDDAKQQSNEVVNAVNTASNRITWVLLSDTDEFVRPNPYISHIVTPLYRKGAVATFLRTQTKSKRTAGGSFQAPACLYVPRIQITSQEYNATSEGKLPPLVPANERFEKLFSDQDFLTTRWMYHNNREFIQGNNHDGKNIINIEQLEYNISAIPKRIDNVHQVLPRYCRSTWNTSEERLHDPTNWLVIHHYLGTLEQYTFRDDPRDDIPGRPKRVDVWYTAGREVVPEVDDKNMNNINTTDDAAKIVLDTQMRAWVAGFVQAVGAENAVKLLEGVGQIKPNKKWKDYLKRIW